MEKPEGGNMSLIEEKLRRKLKREVDLNRWEPILLTAGDLEVAILAEDKEKFLEYLKFLKTFASEIDIKVRRVRKVNGRLEEVK
jgi:hypothetical protein